jgi:hypothetical protein
MINVYEVNIVYKFISMYSFTPVLVYLATTLSTVDVRENKFLSGCCEYTSTDLNLKMRDKPKQSLVL